MPRLLLISALLHAFVGWRLLSGLGGHPVGQAALAAGLVVSALLLPWGLMARRLRKRRFADALAWASLLCMGLFSSLFVLTLLRDAVLLIGAALAAAAPALVDTARLRQGSAAAVPLAALVITLWGLVNARRTAAVVDVEVPIDGLPAALDGFTIAQISDLHVGPTIKRGYVQAVVDAVNALDADMVAVTGDLVDGSVAALGAHVAPLAGLASRHGTFFVTGNHEYYSGAAAWVAELRRLGVRVLLNEHVVLRHGAAGARHATGGGGSGDGGSGSGAGAAGDAGGTGTGTIVVAGVTDPSAHHYDASQRSDPQAALAGAPAGAGMRLLLAHQPRSAAGASDAGFQLQLSGHTHGGQFLPWNFFVRLQQPFTAGLHRWRRLWVYTSRGTGYWGPPKRFGAPSEITRLRLVAAHG